MTTLDFLAHRRKELLDFFSWRFGTPFWIGPAVYCTGVPRYAFTKLRNGGDKRGGTLMLADFVRAEDAARHLGFRPTYPNLTGYQLAKPPPMSLPKWTDPEVNVRFKQWQRETRAGSMNLFPIRKRERKNPDQKSDVSLGRNSLYGSTQTVPLEHQENNQANNSEATYTSNYLETNPPTL